MPLYNHWRSNHPRQGLMLLCLGLWVTGLLASGARAAEVTFAEPRQLGEEQVYDICVGDFDGDGDPDVAGEWHNMHQYIYGHNGRKRPDLAPAKVWENSLPDSSDKVSRRQFSVDLNGDGFDDWVIAPPYPGAIEWKYSMGGKQLGFGKRQSYYEPTGVLAAAPGDINGDGKVDFAVVHEPLGNGKVAVEWLENTGKTDSLLVKHEIEIFDSPYSGADVHAADLNGDGAIDIIANNPSFRYWFENDGKSQPGFTKHALPDDVGGVIKSADLNGDGHMDMVIGNKYLISDGGDIPQFQVGEYLHGVNNMYYIALGDLDDDGDVDIIGYPKQVQGVVWYENDGATFPSYTWHTIHVLDMDYSSAQFYDVKMVDIDQDGDLDVLMAFTVELRPYIWTTRVHLFENLLKSPNDVGLFTPKKGDEFGIGDLMAIKWRSELETSGTSVRLELYAGEPPGKIDELGQDISEEGQGCFLASVPYHLPSGSNYRVRIVSLIDEQYAAFSEPFTIIGKTAVAPEHFELYE